MTPPLSREKIELRLRLLMQNLRMACTGEREGEIRAAEKLLITEVEKLCSEARADMLTALEAIRSRCDGRLGPGRSAAVNEIACMANAAIVAAVGDRDHAPARKASA